MLAGTAAAALLVLGAPTHLYGLTRVKCPSGVPHAPSGCAQLVGVDFSSGVISNIGKGHSQLAAVGDLRTVANGIYYVLADNCGGPCNATGTVLLGLSLADGSVTCKADVPSLAEVGLVGGGQSLSHDAANNRLLLTGPNSTDGGASYTHFVLSAPADASSGSCGPFAKLGEFGDANYEPMAHGSELDAAGQRLFITLSTGARTYGMGVVDVRKGHPVNLTATFPMGGRSSEYMWGPSLSAPRGGSWAPPATCRAASTGGRSTPRAARGRARRSSTRRASRRASRASRATSAACAPTMPPRASSTCSPAAATGRAHARGRADRRRDGHAVGHSGPPTGDTGISGPSCRSSRWTRRRREPSVCAAVCVCVCACVCVCVVCTQCVVMIFWYHDVDDVDDIRSDARSCGEHIVNRSGDRLEFPPSRPNFSAVFLADRNQISRISGTAQSSGAGAHSESVVTEEVHHNHTTPHHNPHHTTTHNQPHTQGRPSLGA